MVSSKKIELRFRISQFFVGKSNLPYTLFFCISLIFLTSCSKQDNGIVFRGESRNWEAVLQFSPPVSEDKNRTKRYVITYKGQGPEKVGRVQYEIKNNDKVPLSNSGLATLGPDHQIRAGGTCSKCPLEVLEDDEWTLTITWNGQTETIHMPKQNEGERIMERSFEPMTALFQVVGIVFIGLIGYIVYRFVKK